MFSYFAYRKAKRYASDEKVGLNIKVPLELKNDFEKACKKRKVSMTEMMLSFIEVFVEDSKGTMDLVPKEFYRLANERISENEAWIKSFYESIEKGSYKMPHKVYIKKGFDALIENAEVDFNDIVQLGRKEKENDRLRELIKVEDKK